MIEPVSSKVYDWKLHRKYICTHITALKAFQNFIFVGESNQIILFDWKNKKLLEKELVFESSTIHGIRISSHFKVIFFGAKSVKIYLFHPSKKQKLTKLSEELFLNDWIHDVCWLTKNEETENSFITVSAHNSVTVWNIKSDQKSTYSCSVNCILYTASIFSHRADSIVIAVGTVFQKILIWSPYTKNDTDGRKLPFQSLSGHQGVLFSIAYSKEHNLISSTSDDRSIRLWKVQNDSNWDEESLNFWETASIQCSLVLFGHESRVWMSAILKDCILSVGEDSCLCYWSLKGDLLKKKKCHKGGSVWCLETIALDSENGGKTNEEYIAFTGGSDGGINMWNIKTASVEHISQISLRMNDLSEKADFPRITSLLNNQFFGNFLVTTDNGWIVLYSIEEKEWKNIFYDKSFASYCVPSISNDGVYLAMGNISGELVLLNLLDHNLNGKTSFKKFPIHESKICSVHWLSKTSDYLLTCGLKGHMIFWQVTYQDESFDLHKLYELHLPKCKHHWWSTAALYVPDHKNIIVGDRGGSISLYSFPKTNSTHENLINPLMSYRSIHGDNGVTDIQKHKSLIYSAGRNGKIQLYNISEGKLNLLHVIKVSHDLEWIGKMLFYGEDLLLLGFHTKDFLVWSTKLECAVMTVECGGGHRSWDFNLSEDGNAIFVAIKKKDIIFSCDNLQHVLRDSILKVGISGQEFCHITHLFSKKYNSSGSLSIAACGGEDNALRIIGFIDIPDVETQIIQICSLSGHLSSIRSISKVKMKHRNAYLLVSVGGRSQMMIWNIKDDSDIECKQLGSYILSEFDKSNKQAKGNRDIQIDPQTRLMDVAVSHSETSGKYTISTACSDSFFRVYLFDSENQELSLVSCIKHGDNCILKLAEISVKENLKNSLFFATGSTNGCVKIFNSDACGSDDDSSANILLKTDLELKAHQSGINALDTKQISGSTWILSCAGDDNALSVMFINFNEDIAERSNPELSFKAHVPHAHASQITGLKIYDDHAIVTTSIDQRVNVWSWALVNNCLSVKLETSTMSLIPDIAHLEVWKNEIPNSWSLLICGQGLENLTLTKCENERQSCG